MPTTYTIFIAHRKRRHRRSILLTLISTHRKNAELFWFFSFLPSHSFLCSYTNLILNFFRRKQEQSLHNNRKKNTQVSFLNSVCIIAYYSVFITYFCLRISTQNHNIQKCEKKNSLEWPPNRGFRALCLRERLAGISSDDLRAPPSITAAALIVLSVRKRGASKEWGSNGEETRWGAGQHPKWALSNFYSHSSVHNCTTAF